MPKYSLRYLTKLLNFPCENDSAVNGVCVDSRLAHPGDLFFALPGAKVDGHAFVEEAFSKGAVGAIVKKGYDGKSKGHLIYVDDVLDTLQTLAKNLLAQWHPKIVAVTGSLGKTTTKEFITSLLRPNYRVSSTPGNSNSQIGVPLSLINYCTGEEEVLVIEMGMTHRGDLAKLVKIAPPDIAVITTTAFVHACNFEDLADIGRAKAEIFSHPRTTLGIMDRAIENYGELLHVGQCRKISFALDISAADYNLHAAKDVILITAPEGQIYMDPLPLPGRHNLHNFLSAAIVARQLGLAWDDIRAAMPALTLPERRMQFIEKNGILFVNDSYNAALKSVKAALDCLPNPRPGGKRVAILGEMLELGKLSEQYHREVAEYALDFIDHMFCFGKDCAFVKEVWKEAGRPVEWHLERAGIVPALRKVIQPGDIVLLKGSRAKEVWKILDEV